MLLEICNNTGLRNSNALSVRHFHMSPLFHFITVAFPVSRCLWTPLEQLSFWVWNLRVTLEPVTFSSRSFVFEPLLCLFETVYLPPSGLNWDWSHFFIYSFTKPLADSFRNCRGLSDTDFRVDLMWFTSSVFCLCQWYLPWYSPYTRIYHLHSRTDKKIYIPSDLNHFCPSLKLALT